MFKLYPVACCPFGIDGFLSDEAMASALSVLMDLVHLALIDSVLFIIMVGNNTVIGSAVDRRETVGH